MRLKRLYATLHPWGEDEDDNDDNDEDNENQEKAE